MKTLIILSAFLLVAFSCKKDLNRGSLTADKEFVNNEAFELGCGESISSTDQSLLILIDSVLNDSRCPKDVVCIWSGNAEVRFIISNKGIQKKFVLNSNSSLRTDTILDGYHIRLVNLRPYPVSTNKISQKEYRAEIMINKE